MRNDDRVTLELAGIQVAAAIEGAELFPSPYTGRELRRLQVSFVIDDEATNNRIVEALEARQEVTLPDGTGQRTSFEPGKTSWSYTDGITRYHHQVELTEQEHLQPTAVVLDQLEITPYAYEECIDDDGVLRIDLKTRVASPTHATLQAMITRCAAGDPSYFPVVRKGLQDMPRTMRLGICTWSAHDGEFKHNLVLVEQTADQHEPDPFVPLDYPEGRRGREMAAKTSALVTELLRALEAKGVLNADEVRQLTAAAKQQAQELALEFSRMDDIDTGL
jgi:hypothetical protein